MDGAAVTDLLTHHRAADLVTATEHGLVATMLPFIYDASVGDHGTLLGHVARNNDQWRLPPLGEALAIVRGPDGYVSPGWYASKAEHGRVVPTWNYVTAHVYGELIVHDEPGWLRDLVDRLTVKHEAAQARPWAATDAPAAYIAGQLRAIVGVELRISRIEAKAKLSQNRPVADIAGVVDGASATGDHALSSAVAAAEAGQPRSR